MKLPSAFLMATAAAVLADTPIDVTAWRPQSEWELGGPAGFSLRLAGTPGARVLSQGGWSGQNDLSIRGSGFSGAGLLLGGLPLRNAQTEHFHAELPVSAYLLDETRALAGADQALTGAGHLIGGIALDFAPVRERGWVEAGGGNGGRLWQEGVWQTGLPALPFGGLSLYGLRHELTHADSAGNGVELTQGGLHLQHDGPAGTRADLVAGAQRKTFGARGFYGASPLWDAEETIDDHLLLGAWRHTGETTALRLAGLWRDTRDDYQLFWDRPTPYRNRHRTNQGSLALDGRLSRADGGARLRWRADAETESLTSLALGDHRRGRLGLFLSPETTLGRLTAQAGLRAQAYSDDTPGWLPQGRLAWRLATGWEAFAAGIATERQPSFTELNYESPGSLGNSGLKRQSAVTWETGVRRASAAGGLGGATLFHTTTRHTVDWVKTTPESTRWVATDLGTIRTTGLELHARQAWAQRLLVRASYTLLWRADPEPPIHAGRYIADYALHDAHVSAVWRVTRTWRALAAQGVRAQADTPARQSGNRVGLDGQAAVFYTPRGADGVQISLRVENLWKDDFESYIGQPYPERRVALGLSYAW